MHRLNFKIMICDCCNNETRKARPVAGYILCNKCNMRLINDNSLVLYNGTKLIIESEVEEKEKELDWFERCRLARLNSEMDGQPLNDIFW